MLISWISRYTQGACLAGALALLGGCASVPTHVDPPKVSLADIHLTGGSLFDPRYHLKLRLDNPNAFDLPLERMTYRVSLNDQPFTTGASSTPVTVPKNGSAIVDIDGSGSVINLLGQLVQAPGHAGQLHYAMDGTVKFQHIPVTFPYHRNGEVRLFR